MYLFGLAKWYVGSQFPEEGSNQHPLCWKHKGVTIELLGKSPNGEI